MKTKTLFKCNNCSYSSTKWIGKCPSCEKWNTFEEITIERKTKSLAQKIAAPANPLPLSQIKKQSFARIPSNIKELDRVLGGGIVEGNLILLSGEPGIGKSTLTLQICNQLAENRKILYISGEESIQQINLRAARLHFQSENLFLLNENKLETIVATIEKENPEFIVIDSIQVISSESIDGSAGSVSQVRFCTENIMNFTKQKQIPTLIIGHVTKDGQLAGPKMLEHLVDTVIHLEGDRYHDLRILRCRKNRFGSTDEVGIFSMQEKGLCEVNDPSKFLIENRLQDAIGSCLTCILEGNRTILVEIQALTSTTAFGYPKRTCSGYDLNRLNLLAAVIQKYTKINLSNQDIYLNVIGGIKINDPSTDLAVCAAIISSSLKKPLPSNTVFIGEVGLSGEIRTASKSDLRLKSIKKMGIKNTFGLNDKASDASKSPLDLKNLSLQFFSK